MLRSGLMGMWDVGSAEEDEEDEARTDAHACKTEETQQGRQRAEARGGGSVFRPLAATAVARCSICAPEEEEEKGVEGTAKETQREAVGTCEALVCVGVCVCVFEGQRRMGEKKSERGGPCVCVCVSMCVGGLAVEGCERSLRQLQRMHGELRRHENHKGGGEGRGGVLGTRKPLNVRTERTRRGQPADELCVGEVSVAKKVQGTHTHTHEAKETRKEGKG